MLRYPRPGLLADERGSVIAMTDGTGTVTQINKYDPYGVPDSENAGRFQFTGQMWIPEVKLYHFKARAYHPGLGRFLQPDPSGYAGGLNLYAYAGDDPENGTDPSGLCDPTHPEYSCADEAPWGPSLGPGIDVIGHRLQPGEIDYDSLTFAPGASSSSLGDWLDRWLRNALTQAGLGDLVKAPAGNQSGPQKDQNQNQQQQQTNKLTDCASQNAGMGMAGAGLFAAGQPIPGTKPFTTPGSSLGTSLAGQAAGALPEVRVPFALPAPVGGPGTGRALAIAVTSSVNRFAARWVPWIGAGLLVADALETGTCTASSSGGTFSGGGGTGASGGASGSW